MLRTSLSGGGSLRLAAISSSNARSRSYAAARRAEDAGSSGPASLLCRDARRALFTIGWRELDPEPHGPALELEHEQQLGLTPWWPVDSVGLLFSRLRRTGARWDTPGNEVGREGGGQHVRAQPGCCRASALARECE